MTFRAGLVVALLSAVGACGGSSSSTVDGDGAGGRPDAGDDASGPAGASGRGGNTGVAGAGGSSVGGGTAGAAGGGLAGSTGGGGAGGAAGGSAGAGAGGSVGGGSVGGSSVGGSSVGGSSVGGGSVGGGSGAVAVGGRGGAGGVAGSGGSGGVAGGGATGGASVAGTGGRAGTGVAGAAGSSVAGTGGDAGTGVAGRGGAAGTGVAGTGIAGGGGGECAPRLLLEGSQNLIAHFVVDEGVIAALSDRVVLVGRNAQIIKSVPFAREITAAAFDGTTLVVADPAALTVMTRSLDVGPSVFVSETCASGVLVSGKRFVCGPANDWNRIFYTYDVGAASPVQIAVSNPYTYHGTPMRRVPGTDDFITVTTNLSPSDFYLYRVDATGKAVYINESPYHGDFAAGTMYAFDGSPAAHLIQSAGLMLKIYGDGCDMTTNSFNTGCFIKDGVLGTLRTGESYLGLGDDAAGTVVAVVGAGNAFDGPCKNGCAFQRIDVGTRTITSQKKHPFTSSSYAVVPLPDPKCANIVLGIPTSTDPFTSARGFRLESFDY